MFDSPHATIFVEFPPYNGGALLLAGTTVVGSRDFGKYFSSGEDSKI